MIQNVFSVMDNFTAVNFELLSLLSYRELSRVINKIKIILFIL